MKRDSLKWSKYCKARLYFMEFQYPSVILHESVELIEGEACPYSIFRLSISVDPTGLVTPQRRERN
jgi:hypothetical protein